VAERTSRRRAAAALALCCALAAGGAAGCGSGGNGDDAKAQAAAFKQGYSRERTALNTTAEQIGTVLTGADGQTDAALSAQLRKVETRYRGQLAGLKALKPPANLQADFATVTRASTRLDTDLLAIVKAVDAHDAGTAQATTQQLVAHIPAVKTASAKVVRALGLPATRDDDTATTATTTASASGAGTAAGASGGRITVTYDRPHDADGRFAREILRLGGTDGVAAGLSHSFVLPVNMGIHVVDGFVGPNYDPQTKTITLSYGFTNYVGEQLLRENPGLKQDQNELGRELAAVDGFVLLHEFGHALIDVYGLPVLGKEEDAADSVATVFLTTTVKHGDEYAYDAAKFFDAMSARQRRLAPSAYWDEHSLDKQRAYEIVCWVAGSSADAMANVRRLGVLPDSRLAGCPGEYQQKVRSWDALLQPHVRS
jgi:hypothetical protein